MLGIRCRNGDRGKRKMSDESKHGDQEPQDDISGLMWTVGVLLAVSMIAAYFISF